MVPDTRLVMRNMHVFDFTFQNSHFQLTRRCLRCKLAKIKEHMVVKNQVRGSTDKLQHDSDQF